MNVLYYEALFYKNKKKLKLSEKCVEKVMDLSEDDNMNFEIMLTRADIAFQSGKYKEALKTIEKLSKITAVKHSKVLKLKAEILFNIGDFEHALLLYYNKGIFNVHCKEGPSSGPGSGFLDMVLFLVSY